MAGAYVNPLMAAIFAINEEMQQGQEKRDHYLGLARKCWEEKLKPNIPPSLLAELEEYGFLEGLEK